MVEFRGYLADVWPALREFQVYALTSVSEGMPISVLEAMSAGLPVVATAVGGLPELVEEGDTGFLVSRGTDRAATAQALADRMGSLLADAGARTRMGLGGSAARERRILAGSGRSEDAALLHARHRREARTGGMVMLTGLDIVCVSSLDWDAHWTSKQQIMQRLAGPNRVLYVEEPVTMLAPLKVPSRWRRWSAVVPRVRLAKPGLWVLTPPPLLPFGNMYPAVNRVNQRVMAGYIRRRLPGDRNETPQCCGRTCPPSVR